MIWRRLITGSAAGICGAFGLLIVLAPGVGHTATVDPAPAAAVESAQPVRSCASLASVRRVPGSGVEVRIERASQGEIDGARYCEVVGLIDSRIRFEVRLPVTGWSQRYVQVGCGGLCGVLQLRLEHADDCQPARDHSLALAATDMGHQGRYMGDGTFGADPQARIDFAYRGVHLTAVVSKALIERYYGRKARYSYFSGCSDGGREALMEAERFPGDFDGIAAGAPAMNFQVQNSFYHAWMYLSNRRSDGTAILTASKLPALHAAALASCDGKDGQVDGVIADPRACHFDPADALCKAGQARDDQCLTPEEVEVARRFYAGPRDEAGHRFTIGGPQAGSELAWRGVFVPDSADGAVLSNGVALDTLRFLSFPDNPPADYSLADFRFDQATFHRLEAMHPLYDATDTDLSGFEHRGGKLILWHGWSDPHISPINTIAYYEAVRRLVGGDREDRFIRLFLLPGMFHCGGGDGFGAFDVLTPLMSWVEQDKAPDRIVAGHAEAGPGAAGPPPVRALLTPGPPPAPSAVTRTRLIFPYPALPRYAGSGAPDLAASYVAGPPLVAGPAYDPWEGESFMSAGFQQECTVAAGRLACRRR